MRARWTSHKSAVTGASLLSLLTASPAFAQGTSPTLGWYGWARCVVSVQGQGYTEQQTHTWTMSGAPIAQGGFRIYPATWSVTGSGGLQKTVNTQTLVAQWTTNVTSMSAPLAVFVRASDGKLLIVSRHAQLRARNAVQGYQQQTVDGKARPPGTLGLEAFEWRFPAIDATPRRTVAGVVQPGTASGSSTLPTNGNVGPMQIAGAKGTAACTWQFGQGAAAPAPPPPIVASPVPVAGP